MFNVYYKLDGTLGRFKTPPSDKWIKAEIDESGNLIFPKHIQTMLDEKEAAQQVKQELTDFEQLIRDFQNEKAKEKGYEDIVSACSYAGYPNVFQEESQAYLAWRAECWTVAHEILNAYNAGEKGKPTPEEVLAAMPELVLA